METYFSDHKAINFFVPRLTVFIQTDIIRNVFIRPVNDLSFASSLLKIILYQKQNLKVVYDSIVLDTTLVLVKED